MEMRLNQIEVEKWNQKQGPKKMRHLLLTGRNLLHTSHRLCIADPERVAKRIALIELWEMTAQYRILENHEDRQELVLHRPRQMEEEKTTIEKVLKRFNFYCPGPFHPKSQ